MPFIKEIKTINAALLFILIVIIGIGFITYQSINQIFDYTESKNLSYNTLNLIEEILSQVAIAEEGQRSYFLTGNDVYLDSYKSAKTVINSDIKKLKDLLTGKFIQIGKADSLIALINKRIAFVDNKVIQQEKGKTDIEIRNIKAGLSEVYVNKVRKIASSMENYEYELLKLKDEGAVSTIRRTSITILIGTLITCIIFLMVFYILSKEIVERKNIENQIREEKDFSERLLNSSIDGITAFDKNLIFSLWNPGMENLTGISKSKVLGKKIFEAFPLLAKIGEDRNILETLKGNYAIVKDKFFSIPETKKKGYIEAYYSPIYNADREITGGLVIIRDRTKRKLALEALEKAKKDLERRVEERTGDLIKVNQELRKEIKQREEAQEQINNSLKEKVVLLREIHHRVKNNLQVISSLLNLQSGYISDKKSLEVFRESQNRVRSMALVHEKLYRSKSLNKIDFSDYINSLAKDLFNSYSIENKRINFISDFDGTFLEIDTGILCGLIVNELISNSLKHAFPNGRKGEIYISIHINSENKYGLTFKDNGIGFPDKIDFRNTDSLGLQLVTSLTSQLGGEIELKRNGFTEFEITFPAGTK
ncbi:MAG: histidine kinase dimerization/phosphoacceptor domain -containing protein [Ignavibacteriaceae bacterium]